MPNPSSIYIIAGEASGDVIGGQLMAALAQRQPIAFSGIGGEQMQAQGLSSLFAMQELSLMGFAEVLPHVFRLKRRIAQTVAAILKAKPEILITIDSPGFTFRVVKSLKQQGFTAPCVHVVAPTVWAYKPHRAAKTAALFDALLCILPFEPPYFERHGLAAHFIGHPIAWLHRTRGNGAAFRLQHAIAADATLMGMMAGSRRGELAKHLPIFGQTIALLKAQIPSLHVLVMTTNAMAATLQAEAHSWGVPYTLIASASAADKADALAACQFALSKSGTVALECSLAGLPIVTTYRAHPLTAWLLRRLIRIPYAHLINIMAYFVGKPAPIPEYIQERCNPQGLSAALLELHQSEAARSAQIAACTDVGAQLGMQEAQSPSEKAAEIILQMLPSLAP